jgi:hypothetical protein
MKSTSWQGYAIFRQTQLPFFWVKKTRRVAGEASWGAMWKACRGGGSPEITSIAKLPFFLGVNNRE